MKHLLKGDDEVFNKAALVLLSLEPMIMMVHNVMILIGHETLNLSQLQAVLILKNTDRLISIIKHLLEAVVTFKKVLCHQSSPIPVQGGSPNRNLLFNVPDPFFLTQYKRKSSGLTTYVRLVCSMWCTPHSINWIISITFGFNKILKK